MIRATFATGPFWHRPYSTHDSDEQFMLFESLALWEGISPESIGWPGSTTRLVLSVVYAGLFVVESGFNLPANPGQLFEAIGHWIATKGDDPLTLYVVARWVSVVIGTLQILVAAWAVGRGAGPLASVIAALMCATSPIAINYSQLVLADMTALTFTFVLMGILAGGKSPTPLTPVAMGACLGLAVASKHHYAIWAVAIVVFWALRLREIRPEGVLKSLTIAAIAALTVYAALAPWASINPVLAAKEFVGTVVVKVTGSHGPVAIRGPMNVLYPMWTWGLWVMVAPLLALWTLRSREHLRAHAPGLAVAALSILLLFTSGRVFSRYGLLFFPVAIWLGAEATATAIALSRGRQRARFAAVLILLITVPVTIVQVIKEQSFLGALSSYALAHDWVNANVPWGARIAIFSEDPQRYKRTREQLEDILRKVDTPAAYAEKMATNGLTASSAAMPMRTAVLNDEMSAAFWALRELGIRRPGEGYVLKRYHDDAKYDGLRTRDALSQFRTGQLDVLVLNRVETSLPSPVIVFPGQPGEPLYVHVQPGLLTAMARSRAGASVTQ